MAPFVSVVIPAYNEAERLPPTLASVRRFLEDWGRPYEIVVVDDGSFDATAERARQAGGPFATVLANGRNRGKGHSVRRGMLAATGRGSPHVRRRSFDPHRGASSPVVASRRGHDVAIGSRALPDSRVEVRQPFYRESLGRLFNRPRSPPALERAPRHPVRVQALHRARPPALSFEPARLDGFSFDVETLFIARRRGFKIAEVRGHLAQRRREPGGHGAGGPGLLRSPPHPRQRPAWPLRRARRSGVVAHLGRGAKLLDPPFDAGVEVLAHQPLAERSATLPRRTGHRGAPRTRWRRHRARPRRTPGPGEGSAGRCT